VANSNPWLKGDVVSGAVLAALGVYIVSAARHWDYHSPEGPGPGFFPMWYGIALIVLSLLLIAGTVMRPAPGGKAVEWRGVGRALTVWAAFAVCVAMLQLLGLLTALALLTLFIVSVMYGKPLKTAFAVAIGNAAGFYLVFPFALGVNLPVGPFGF
jgi:putative tricarboxylic transport membrane protein